VIDGEEREETVHNVHAVGGYGALFGFVTRRDGREEVRKMTSSEVWETYEGSGL
jgi:hypothetical protein